MTTARRKRSPPPDPGRVVQVGIRMSAAEAEAVRAAAARARRTVSDWLRVVAMDAATQ